MPLNQNVILAKRYRIIKVLGTGGFGAVYLAEDSNLGNRFVAIKETLDSSKDGKQLLTDEANIMASLRHPNLVTVLDQFSEGTGSFVIMEYVEGNDLWEKTETAINSKRPLPVPLVMDWTKQICSAVAYLHSKDIIHRDIKPQNMRLQPDGRVILLDLGIAKKGGSSKTGRLKKAFTPVFAPPEQYTGSTSYPADVYALGMCMYVMLTATYPPEAMERVEIPQKVLILPTQLNPVIPPALEQIIIKATEISSTKRYSNGGEMLAAINSATISPQTPHLIIPRFCPYCGSQNRELATFCSQCGRRIARQSGT